jgi:DNA-damage-inducible protein D
MSNIKLFESKRVRSVWNKKEQKWYFVVEDVVAVLTDSNDPKQYIKRMGQRDLELAKGWGTNCTYPFCGHRWGMLN